MRPLHSVFEGTHVQQGYNIRTNAALYPNCPLTALPLYWDEELSEPVQNIREHGGFDLVM